MNIKTQDFCSKAERAARLMKSLANAHRLVILCRLHEGECAVGTLEKMLRINQSALSQHLARLRRDKIVTTRRDAQTIYYRLADTHADKIIRQLYSLYCQSTASAGMPTKTKGGK